MPEPFDAQSGCAPDLQPDACEELVDYGEENQTDATTGASPGTAQACDDLGLNSLEENLKKFNIKPPGVS